MKAFSRRARLLASAALAVALTGAGAVVVENAGSPARAPASERYAAATPSAAGSVSPRPSPGAGLVVRPVKLDQAERRARSRHLQTLAARLRAARAAVVREPLPPPHLDFVVSSFNVLGSSHTARGGDRPRWAAGRVRAGWAGSLLLSHQVDIVGFQELQPDQQLAVGRATGGRYQMYPGPSGPREQSVNSIAWLTSRWQPVVTRTVPIPYFGGRIRQMPVVRLKSRITGAEVWVANFHNPANSHGDAERWRNVATEREINLVHELEASGNAPVIFTGDFNEREDFFCPVVARTSMRASSGGSSDGVCRPPRPMFVDWILATPGVQWRGHVDVTTGIVRRTTDHPMVLAHGRVATPPAPKPKVDLSAVREAARALKKAQSR